MSNDSNNTCDSNNKPNIIEYDPLSELVIENSNPKNYLIIIKKCECNPYYRNHVITPNSNYYRCNDCDIDLLESHLVADQYYANGNVLCGMCSKVLELKNTGNICDYTTSFNYLIDSAILNKDGYTI